MSSEQDQSKEKETPMFKQSAFNKWRGEHSSADFSLSIGDGVREKLEEFVRMLDLGKLAEVEFSDSVVFAMNVTAVHAKLRDLDMHSTFLRNRVINNLSFLARTLLDAALETVKETGKKRVMVSHLAAPMKVLVEMIRNFTYTGTDVPKVQRKRKANEGEMSGDTDEKEGDTDGKEGDTDGKEGEGVTGGDTADEPPAAKKPKAAQPKAEPKKPKTKKKAVVDQISLE